MITKDGVVKILLRSWRSLLTASLLICLFSSYLFLYFEDSEFFVGCLDGCLYKIRLFEDPAQLNFYKPLLWLEEFIRDPKYGVFHGQVHSGASLPHSLEPSHIHLILPENYKGLIRFTANEFIGVNVTPQNGYRTYQVPKDGIVLIKTKESLNCDHSVTAVYTNGDWIPLASLNPSGKNVLHGPFATSQCLLFFVGSKDELDKTFLSHLNTEACFVGSEGLRFMNEERVSR